MFDDVRLPEDIERGAQGGPGFRTTVVSLSSGKEQRNAAWEVERGVWQIGYGIRHRDDMEAVYGFFKARRGMWRAFRFRDWLDFSLDAELTVGIPGIGFENMRQIVKTYEDTVTPYQRPIRAPIMDTLKVYISGIETTDYTYLGGGVLEFPTNPTGPVNVTGEFDVIARFGVDDLQVQLNTYREGTIPSIPIIELKFDTLDFIDEGDEPTTPPVHLAMTTLDGDGLDMGLGGRVVLAEDILENSNAPRSGWNAGNALAKHGELIGGVASKEFDLVGLTCFDNGGWYEVEVDFAGDVRTALADKAITFSGRGTHAFVGANWSGANPDYTGAGACFFGVEIEAPFADGETYTALVRDDGFLVFEAGDAEGGSGGGGFARSPYPNPFGTIINDTLYPSNVHILAVMSWVMSDQFVVILQGDQTANLSGRVVDVGGVGRYRLSDANSITYDGVDDVTVLIWDNQTRYMWWEYTYTVVLT